jgi:hypothetical protein
MRTTIAAIVFVLLATPPCPAAAQALTWTAKMPALVCRDQDTLDRAGRILASGDKEAWSKFALALAITERCIVIDKGETVFGRVESVWGGTLRIRRKGQLTEYLAQAVKFDLDQAKR